MRREGLHIVIERGPLETALTRHVRAHDVELVLMGTQARSSLMACCSAARPRACWTGCLATRWWCAGPTRGRAAVAHVRLMY